MDELTTLSRNFSFSEPFMFTVLVLASSPTDQGPLHLGKELKVIRHSHDSAPNREQFRIETCTATTVDDLRRYLVNHAPAIVHFSGHGGGPSGLCFEDDQGRTHEVNGDRLAKLFHLVQDDVKCVVLNACFSETQAKAISEHIDFVVGMKDEIGDAAAIKFAQGFYEAVWAGHTYERAFKFGCSAIDTANIPEEHIPVILRSPRLGGLRLGYSENTQHMENFILRYANSTPEEQAKLTTKGDDLRDTIFDSRKNGSPRKWTSVSVLNTTSLTDGFVAALAVVRSGLQSTEHTFYLKPAGDSFLLDWEATMGWWPIPLKTLKALGFSQPLEVRVIASLDDYFNYGFNRNKFISFKLDHLYDGNIHGYVHRHNPLCRELAECLFDGDQHRIMVEIVQADHPAHVLITKFISDTWIRPYEQTGAIAMGSTR